MKTVYKIFLCAIAVAIVGVCVQACSRGGSLYDSALCRTLAIKIERHDSLSQRDYSLIIEQDEQILQYLISRADDMRGIPEEERDNFWRSLTSDPEYMERFGYMFTLGSALYQADTEGLLDERNAERYRSLDEYNEQLADYVTR